MELPATLERKADFLAEVTTKEGKELILHVEFQTQDDSTMLDRMMLYHTLIFGKFKKPVKQMVIYLGQKLSKMRTKLKTEEVFNEFTLLSLQTLQTKTFLEADTSEMLLLALLTNYKNNKAKKCYVLSLRRWQEIVIR
ncbi:MAG: hypothetical protein ACFB0B_07450 [Thermonemataceae bacterium]